MVVLHFENTYQGNITMQNGRPQTSKENKESHGYGTLSMQMIAEKYNGTLTFSTSENTFIVNILFPVFNKQEAKDKEPLF